MMNIKVKHETTSEKESEMCFSFGALADKFSIQCEKQGYKLNNADKWDLLVNYTIMLYIHNVLTDIRCDECLKRILKMSKKNLIKIRSDEE